MDEPIAADRVRALLFDLGGVLIDIDFGRCLARWADGAGCEVDEITARFTFDAAYEDHERGTIDAAGYFEALRRSLDVDLADDVLLEGWTAIYRGVDARVGELLVRAKDRFPLYAFTNSNPSHQAVWSTRFALELEVFEEVFVSSEIGHRKPDAAAFASVASMMGVDAASVLFFDDGEENVVGARAAGMQAVHVTSAASVDAALTALGV